MILAFPLTLIGLFFDLLLSPFRLLTWRKKVPKGSWLTITIDGPVVDVVGKPRFWQWRKQKSLSLHLLDEVVSVMIRDPRVTGLLVTIRGMTAGMASALSLRSILARARSAGKEVAIHLPRGGDTKEVYIATAATKVLLGPSAQLAPLGFRSASHYMKRALDRAGIEPQVFACGEFKSAGESLVRDDMSPAQRAQLERLLETFHDALVDGIAEGRKVSRDRAIAIVDDAPYFGKKAIDAGLADDLAYEDEVPKRLGIDPERGRRDALIEAGHYLARSRRRFFRRHRRPPTIAVVAVHGAIAHAGGPFGSVSTDERLARSIRAARHDRRVRGVILHIDSPGGSALASDLMHHEIEQLAREKPVVACMANVAASGGYYVAAPAAVIVAQPTTVTGSIGVVAARLSLQPLLSRLGIRTEAVEKGKHANLLSPMGPLDEESRLTIMRELDATYQAFVGVVARGREMPEDQIERLARGRVYTGRDAKDVGLVDVLGGFDVAIEEVKKLLDERGERIRDRVEVSVIRTPRNPMPVPDLPDDEDGDNDKEKEAGKKAVSAILAAVFPHRERMIINLALSGERVLAISPISET